MIIFAILMVRGRYKGKRKGEKRCMKARIFNIMQYVRHPETGEELLNEDTIIDALNHRTIKRWAYILHDSDVYSAKDELDDASHTEGKTKPPHWHIVIQMGSNQAETSTIAKWFGISENYVDVPKGVGANKFLDCVQYLTHETEKQQKLGKHRYEDEKVKSNFDWRAELDNRAANRLKYGKDLTPTQQMLYDVMYNGMTLRVAEKKDAFIYMDNLDKLTKYRLDYIRRMKPPANRINYYLYGKGGVGKDLMSRALARALFPQFEDDEDIFFVVGAGNVTFDGYDGQPVLIWSDRRAGGLIKALGGRENLFNVFETHPTKQRQNIKYGSINLCNVVNIVNGQESYAEFLDGIAGEYSDRDGNTHEAEDKNQGYRRFPFIIPLHDTDFDLMVNKGYMDNDRTLFQEYYKYMGIRGNMQKIVVACGGENDFSRKVSSKVVKPITDKHKEAMEKHSEDVDVDNVLNMMEAEGWGTQSDGNGEELVELSKHEDDVILQEIREQEAKEYEQIQMLKKNSEDGEWKKFKENNGFTKTNINFDDLDDDNDLKFY